MLSMKSIISENLHSSIAEIFLDNQFHVTKMDWWKLKVCQGTIRVAIVNGVHGSMDPVFAAV